jgi:hypothetical protein
MKNKLKQNGLGAGLKLQSTCLARIGSDFKLQYSKKKKVLKKTMAENSSDMAKSINV